MIEFSVKFFILGALGICSFDNNGSEMLSVPDFAIEIDEEKISFEGLCT